jgi:hypothetical protein
MLDVIEAIRGLGLRNMKRSCPSTCLTGTRTAHEDYMKQVGKAHAFKLIKQDLEEIEQRYIED